MWESCRLQLSWARHTEEEAADDGTVLLFSLQQDTYFFFSSVSSPPLFSCPFPPLANPTFPRVIKTTGVEGGPQVRTKWHSLFQVDPGSDNRGPAGRRPGVKHGVHVSVYHHGYVHTCSRPITGQERFQEFGKKCPFNDYLSNHFALFDWIFTSILYEMKRHS